MKLLITGGSGQLGSELARKSTTDHSIIALARAELDITKAQQIHAAIEKHQPDFLINAAAYTAVDKAESETDLVYKINRDGPALLAQICAQKKIPLIHVSTDYVFDGNAQQPYQETDAVDPINVYGASKLAGEIAVREHCPQHIILRVSGVFGIYGNNFVKTILRLAQEKETLQIISDKIACPTPAADIADAIITICQRINNQWGTYHYCSSEPTSWYHFAATIVGKAKKYNPLAVKEILAIPSAEYPTPAKRPAYSALDCAKIQAAFAIRAPSWELGLAQIMRELSA